MIKLHDVYNDLVNTYPIILSYDIADKNKEIRPDLTALIGENNGIRINKSVYGFKNISFEALEKMILNLKAHSDIEFSDATDIRIFVSEDDKIITKEI